MKRVIAKMYTSYDYRTRERENTLIQYLQQRNEFKICGVKLFSFWLTIDKETVPSFAWIEKNTLGSTDWKSKWYGMENIPLLNRVKSTK